VTRQAFSLYCLPYAGAGAGMYSTWRARLPRSIDLIALHLPGRGIRSAEPPIHDWTRLTDVVMADIDRSRRGPFGLFGHSMGALIALEVAHAIRERWGESPAWLGVSACQAPSRRTPDLKWLTCRDHVVRDELCALGGTPPELLENGEMLDLLTPVLRADFHLCGSYRRPERAPLGCAMLVLGGTRDDISHPRENLTTWSAETTGPCQVTMIEGGHFFIHEQADATVGQVVASLSSVMRAIRPIPA
jgi:surfactin synthase thioesterase subunit